MNRRALQRQTPKRPHKPSSQNRGARTLGIDTENIEFHLNKMKQWEGPNELAPEKYAHSKWYYHRGKYRAVTTAHLVH